jgi:subtilisin family serine protease
MKYLFALTLLAFAAAASTPGAPKRYIIKFKAPIHSSFSQLVSTVNARNPTSLTPDNLIKYNYDATVFNGVAGTFTPAFLDELKRQHPNDVAYIAEDGKRHIVGSQRNPPSWGLTRVGEHDLNLSLPYAYPDVAGEGVDVWVIDTGVQDTHTDFGGRAKLVKSFVANETATDLNGHGTHCSGTIGSATYGVAKKASIFGLKVMNGKGEGEDSDLIAAVQYVVQNVRKGKTVISMSLGGPKTQPIDDAMNAAVAQGVVAIVAAGNDGADACEYSPAGASAVLAVGATDRTDTIASFSNYGKCVGIFGPGVNIKSLWKGREGATNTISGTSMATPHVAGVAALYMSAKDYNSPQEVYDALKAAATKGVIKELPDSDSPNSLVFNTAK